MRRGACGAALRYGKQLVVVSNSDTDSLGDRLAGRAERTGQSQRIVHALHSF